MKGLLLALILTMNVSHAYDWNYADLENCSSYDLESFNSDTDFAIKCLDDEEDLVYLEDYFNLQD